MLGTNALLALATTQLASAHFGLTFPSWRADTLSEAGEEKYSQWTYPCAGVDYNTGNTTLWPLDGGSVVLDLHHPWTYVFINLGLGQNATNFNVSLTPQLQNATGKGNLCIEKLKLPIKVAEGTNATIQVVTVGESGSALYNCADIRFSKDAKGPENCTSSGVEIKAVGAGGSSASNSSSGGPSGGSQKGDGGSAAGLSSVNMVSLTSAVGLAVVFTMGLSL